MISIDKKGVVRWALCFEMAETQHFTETRDVTGALEQQETIQVLVEDLCHEILLTSDKLLFCDHFLKLIVISVGPPRDGRLCTTKEATLDIQTAILSMFCTIEKSEC